MLQDREYFLLGNKKYLEESLDGLFSHKEKPKHKFLQMWKELPFSALFRGFLIEKKYIQAKQSPCGQT